MFGPPEDLLGLPSSPNVAQTIKPTHQETITSFSVIAELTKDDRIEKSGKKSILVVFGPITGPPDGL